MSLQVEELTADYTGMITDAEREEFQRYDGTDQSNILPVLIESAIRQAEGYCQATFGTKTFNMLIDAVAGRRYPIPFAPILAVSAVVSVDRDGDITAKTLNTGYFVGGLQRKYISFASSCQYKVSYSAGILDPADINKRTKEGILTILSECFEKREDSTSEPVVKLSRNSMVKLAPFRNKIL
jgi:hypothetical protein